MRQLRIPRIPVFSKDRRGLGQRAIGASRHWICPGLYRGPYRTGCPLSVLPNKCGPGLSSRCFQLTQRVCVCAWSTCCWSTGMLLVHIAPNLQLARTAAAFLLPLFNLFCVSAGPAPFGAPRTLGVLWSRVLPQFLLAVRVGSGSSRPSHPSFPPCPPKPLPAE